MEGRQGEGEDGLKRKPHGKVKGRERPDRRRKTAGKRNAGEEEEGTERQTFREH